jgi:hypothetical protein
MSVVERTEWMAAESAARALGILARWATRRLEVRISQPVDGHIRHNSPNGYAPNGDEEQT